MLMLVSGPLKLLLPCLLSVLGGRLVRLSSRALTDLLRAPMMMTSMTLPTSMIARVFDRMLLEFLVLVLSSWLLLTFPGRLRAFQTLTGLGTLVMVLSSCCYFWLYIFLQSRMSMILIICCCFCLYVECFSGGPAPSRV